MPSNSLFIQQLLRDHPIISSRLKILTRWVFCVDTPAIFWYDTNFLDINKKTFFLFFFKFDVIPKEGLTTTQDIKDLFV